MKIIFNGLKKGLTFFLLLMLITAVFIMASTRVKVNSVLSAPLIIMNYQSLVSSGDVHHTGIITTSRYGNGDFAALFGIASYLTCAAGVLAFCDCNIHCRKENRCR
jgi:hypothetical protein